MAGLFQLILETLDIGIIRVEIGNTIKMYKIERQIAGGKYYETMLSPLNTTKEVYSYLKKYRSTYPPECNSYKITCLKTDKIKILDF
jgi:hypothetical protein